jgi:hypothetical protein
MQESAHRPSSRAGATRKCRPPLTGLVPYSTLLHDMSRRSRAKQRVTFRIDPEIGTLLRQLPNQTAFVEQVLREALARICPLCAGTGEVRDVHLAVSNLKKLAVGRLDRVRAAQLKALVRLGRQLLATNLELEPSRDDGELEFRLARADELLLTGRIPRSNRDVTLTH